ncbi:MAG: SDR family oxidoreductase [Spirochaetaceae bacterium]|nr:MAG: SDR family oxidoreductase [Spirochaetaceae bacterium]
MDVAESPVVYITGGARGIGRGCAAWLLNRGLRVAIVDSDAAALERTREELENGRTALDQDPGPAGTPRVLAIAADIRDEPQVEATINRTLEHFGRLDAVVNNAAVSAPSRVGPQELSLQEWLSVIDTNLTAAFLTAKYAAPALRENRGSIINIASTRALQSEPGSEAYAASKGGLIALTHALALSLGPAIRVNAISPGWIDVSDPPQPLTPQDHSQHPAGRVGVPEDIAAMVAYLISPEAGFITGQNFVIDGGMTRKMIYRE